MVAAATAVAAAVAVGLVLGGSLLEQGTSTRSEVARYIEGVDTVQQQMRLQLTQLATVYRTFTGQSTTPAAKAQLAAAERTLATLERRVAGLDAPPAAARLRALVLRLVGAEKAVAHEIDRLASFMPRFRAVLSVSTAANHSLARALAAIVPPKAKLVRGTNAQIAAARAAYAAAAAQASIAQAAAVDSYDRVLALVLRSLRTLRPPPLMRPVYSAQLRTVEATLQAGAALARELRKPNRSRVPELDRRFTEATRIAGSVAAQRAEIAAIDAYNTRVRALSAAQARVQTEILRLQTASV